MASEDPQAFAGSVGLGRYVFADVKKDGRTAVIPAQPGGHKGFMLAEDRSQVQPHHDKSEKGARVWAVGCCQAERSRWL